MLRFKVLYFLLVCCLALPLEAAQPIVGRKAGDKYFKNKKQANNQEPSTAEEAPPSRSVASTQEHYMALHFGSYVHSDSYHWGQEAKLNDAGKLTMGVTYQIGDWANSMDLLFRADILTATVDGVKLSKLSVLPLVTFPDVTTRFPIYFGFGAGLGVFFKQLSTESNLSLDYQLLMGVRIFDLIENVGFLVEGGLKNHVHLLSDGQFNGGYVAAGTVFTF